MRVAVIPARGGSKRIPRKNIREFCGRPMMAWSIAAAQASQLFDRIIVSTDDDEIAAVAAQWGAEVPFRRPAALSDDHTGTGAVVAHAAHWLLAQPGALDAVCCIYATAPFIQVDDLRRGADALAGGTWSYVMTATTFPAPVFRAFRQRQDGGLEMFFPEHAATRSQDLPVALHDAGQFYWGKVAAWTSARPIFDRHTLPLIIPRWRVQDIDDEDDWRRAGVLFQQLGGGQ